MEQHYNEVLQTLSQRYADRASGLEEEKKRKLESLYAQLLPCGQALDRSKDLIESAQEVHRSQDHRLLLKVTKALILPNLLTPVRFDRNRTTDSSR